MIFPQHKFHHIFSMTVYLQIYASEERKGGTETNTDLFTHKTTRRTNHTSYFSCKIKRNPPKYEILLYLLNDFHCHSIFHTPSRIQELGLSKNLTQCTVKAVKTTKAIIFLFWVHTKGLKKHQQQQWNQLKLEERPTSQPVASERLLILIKGVLPMASMRPFLALFLDMEIRRGNLKREL